MKVGDLFRFRITTSSIHTDVEGLIGIVLGSPNRIGQRKVQVGHKTLWLLIQDMEAL